MNCIDRDEIKRRLKEEGSDNDSKRGGFALVNVLNEEDFLDEHIPHSLNIPEGREDEFPRRFDRAKEIVLYSRSASCPAAAAVAQRLASMKYLNVRIYEGGLSNWKEAGNQLERGQGRIYEMRAG